MSNSASCPAWQDRAHSCSQPSQDTLPSFIRQSHSEKVHYPDVKFQELNCRASYCAGQFYPNASEPVLQHNPPWNISLAELSKISKRCRLCLTRQYKYMCCPLAFRLHTPTLPRYSWVKDPQTTIRSADSGARTTPSKGGISLKTFSELICGPNLRMFYWT